MSELPGRVSRAFRDHDAFESVDETVGRFRSTSTPFEGVVVAEPVDGGRTRFEVTVRVPMLDEVTEDDVAPVVEEGWFETLERRVADAGGIFEGDRDVEPETEETVYGGERVAEVRASFEDIDPRRGVNDAAAIVDYVEGTYVQGIVPGYDYSAPATDLISKARQAGGGAP